MSAVLVLNPRSDATFVQHARNLVDEGLSTAAELEAALRRTYPRAVVRERNLSSEAIVTWYVYREGRWIPSD